MFDQIFRSAMDTLSFKGVRHVLWFFLVLAVFYAIFETETNYFELDSISKRLEILEKINQQQLSPEQTARIQGLKEQIENEFETVQANHENKGKQFSLLAWRFIKGAWVAIPLFILTIASGLFAVVKAKGKFVGQTLIVGLWFHFLSNVAWVATALGIISMFLNTSQSFFFSWIAFPVLSSCVLIVIAFWVVLLRLSLPTQSNASQPNGITENKSEAGS